MLNPTLVSTPFTEIEFNPANHTYTLNGQKLTSVSKTLKPLKPVFDSEYWSERKAKERGVTPDIILAEWDAKRQASLEKGNRIHAYIEDLIAGETSKDITFDPFLPLNEDARLPEQTAFDLFWKQMEHKVVVEAVEWIIGDAELGIAGTADSLLFSADTGCYHLWDWKTNARFRHNNRCCHFQGS